jgi:hypothetical protein
MNFQQNFQFEKVLAYLVGERQHLFTEAGAKFEDCERSQAGDDHKNGEHDEEVHEEWNKSIAAGPVAT